MSAGSASTTPEVHTDLPGPRAEELLKSGGFDMQAFYRAVILDDERSAGCQLVDVDGNRFLDFFSSFALGALGFNHPAIDAVVRSDEYARAAANPTSTPFVTTSTWLRFMDRLERVAPAGATKAFCVDGGGEAVESALKAAFIVHGERRRRAAGLPENPAEVDGDTQAGWMHNAGTGAVVVSFDGAFHGRGLGPMSASHSKVMHKADLPAFPWPSAPFPAHRFPRDRYAEENARAEEESLAAVARLLEENEVAAVLVEPIQCEGGDRHTSARFFARLRRMTADASVALIFDEVQTGGGVTGALWAHQHLDLPAPPDMVVFGKKLQLGGFFATPDYDIRRFGRMYQTRNGDRAKGMIAGAVLDTIESEGLLARVAEGGAQLLAGLEQLADRYPELVSQPRGLGYLAAFDLPTPESRDDFLKRALRRGVFASYTGTRSVRLRPHLITGPAEIEQALALFDATLSEM